MASFRVEYPAAQRLNLVEDLFGHQVADPYRWLEDPDSPQTARMARRRGVALGRLPGRPDRPGGLRRPGAGAAPGRVGGPARLARDDAVLHPARPGPGARGSLRRRHRTGRRTPGADRLRRGRRLRHRSRRGRGGDRAGADRPRRHRSLRADDAGRLAAGQGGAAARVPALARRGRGVAAAGARRRDRRAGGRADRPVPVLRGRLAARRQGVLLRAAAAAGRGPRGRGAVPPAGVPAPGGDVAGVGRGGVRRGTRQDHLLRGQRQHGRALADHLGLDRDRAEGGHLDRRPDRQRPRVPAAGPAHGRARRAGVASDRPGRAALRADRPGRAARPALRRRPGRAGARGLARPDTRGRHLGAAQLRDPRRPAPAGADRLPDAARGQRGRRARPGQRRAAERARAARDRFGGRDRGTAGGRARGVVRLHGLHDAAHRAPLRRGHRGAVDLGQVARRGRHPAGDRVAGHLPVRRRHRGPDGGHRAARRGEARQARRPPARPKGRASSTATAGSTSA